MAVDHDRRFGRLIVLVAPVAGLRAALEQSAEAAGCALDFVGSRSVDAWHRLAVIVGGDGADDWLDGLDAGSIDVPGFALAQLEVGTVERQGKRLLVEIEALTVREA